MGPKHYILTCKTIDRLSHKYSVVTCMLMLLIVFQASSTISIVLCHRHSKPARAPVWLTYWIWLRMPVLLAQRVETYPPLNAGRSSVSLASSYMHQAHIWQTKLLPINDWLTWLEATLSLLYTSYSNCGESNCYYMYNVCKKRWRWTII